MNTKQIYDNLKLSNEYKLTIDESSRAVIAWYKLAHCYVEIDTYTPNNPLQITDDGETFYQYIFPGDQGLFPENFIKLDNKQKQQVMNILDKDNIGFLSRINEVVIDTTLNSESKDVKKFLFALNEIEQLKLFWKNNK